MKDYPESKNALRNRIILAYILLPLIGTYLGFSVWQDAFFAYSSGAFVRWQMLPRLQEPVTQMLEANPNSLYVQTEAGIYLMLDVQGCLKHGGDRCWRKVEAVDTQILDHHPCSSQPPMFHVAPTPVGNFERIDIYECFLESYNETHYLRDFQGNIWVWQWGNFSMGMIVPYFCTLFSGVSLGLVVGIWSAIKLVSLLRSNRQ